MKNVFAIQNKTSLNFKPFIKAPFLTVSVRSNDIQPYNPTEIL